MGERWGWGPATTYLQGSHPVEKQGAYVHPGDKCRSKVHKCRDKVHPRYKHGDKAHQGDKVDLETSILSHSSALGPWVRVSAEAPQGH